MQGSKDKLYRVVQKKWLVLHFGIRKFIFLEMIPLGMILCGESIGCIPESGK
jgi:hypothetical protein